MLKVIQQFALMMELTGAHPLFFIVSFAPLVIQFNGTGFASMLQ